MTRSPSPNSRLPAAGDDGGDTLATTYATPSADTLPLPPAHVHLVGIGGAGVSGLARMLHGRGYRVSGSDMHASETTADLAALGISVQIGHQAAHVAGADLVVATAAARDTNPEIAAARVTGIPLLKRAALLGMLANPRQCLAVAGSHGKSTTSGMATLALEQAGVDPAFAIGATVRELGQNARDGSGPHFVVEADEYDYSFLWLRPQVAIITNIEFDHPDLFADRAAVLRAFERFIEGINPGGTLVLNADDDGCRDLLAARDANPAANTAYAVVTFGAESGDWRLVDTADGPAAQDPHGQMFALSLSVPGRHNLMNALAVLAASSGLRVVPAALLPGLQAFGGVSRRFETLRSDDTRVVISDYAHHPTEVAATILAARQRYPVRRIMAIFQPHTYTRTAALLDEFAAALALADDVVLADIYASRETDTLGITSDDIAQRMPTPATRAADWHNTVSVVRGITQAGDVLLIMGAGDIHQAALVLASDVTGGAA